MTREEYDALMKQQIADGEITPEDAESEWDFYVNGWDSYQSIYGY